MHVGRLCRHRRQLRRLLRLLFDLGDLLALLRGRRDLHPQDDVPHLGLCQRLHVHVVLLAVVVEDEVLQGDLNMDPLVVGEGGPHVVRLGDGGLLGLEDDLGLVVVHVQGAQDQNEPREGSVGGDALEPVVVDVEEDHLGLGCLQDEVPELLDLHARLERQLQLAALDHDVGEVQQMDFERIEHAFAGDNDLLGLLLDGEGADEGGDLLGGLPLGELPEALLAGPHGRVDDLEE
mmetsp:Transcript_3635/g.6371  ORF Transcript_3635/g.6371 Transcript_3635/m.6371 type:complete len:234 (-) Transcript_3635:407-1108(-)